MRSRIHRGLAMAGMMLMSLAEACGGSSPAPASPSQSPEGAGDAAYAPEPSLQPGPMPAEVGGDDGSPDERTERQAELRNYEAELAEQERQ